MRGYVGVTDTDWYRHLLARPHLDEVNFWQPSGGRAFRLPEWSVFFFKLKAPHNAVCGLGLFARHAVVPAWLAWESFGEANGASGFEEMRRRIERYRTARDTTDGRYPIGCLMIASPRFFPPDEWVAQPADWSPNIVSGKGYDLTTGEGRRLLDACRERVGRLDDALAAPRYGEPVPTRPRLGQGTFRVGVLGAYDTACAVTGEHSLPVVDAAHIRPYAAGGPHLVSNGLALRTDLHRLFDLGYVTVAPDGVFHVSGRLRDDWANGRSYYALDGTRTHRPGDPVDRPDPAALSWHNEAVFRG